MYRIEKDYPVCGAGASVFTWCWNREGDSVKGKRVDVSRVDLWLNIVFGW